MPQTKMCGRDFFIDIDTGKRAAMNQAIVSLNCLLSAKEMDGFSCVCCQQFLNRRITGVHIIDNPDTVRFFRTGEIVMTTGYILKDFSKQDLEKLLRHLCERGCSGIVFKVNRFYEKVPEDIIQYALQYDIPIVTMPYKYAMADVQAYIMRMIFMNDYNVKTKAVGAALDEEQGYEDFLKLLLEETNEETLAQVCRTQNFDSSLDYFCIFCRALEEDTARIGQAIKGAAGRSGMVCRQFMRTQAVVYLLGKKKLKYPEEVQVLREEVREELSHAELESFIGIGEPVRKAGRIKKSYEQARLTALFQEKKQDYSIAFYRENEMLLCMYRDMKKESIEKIYEKIMLPIITYDAETGAELMKTVQVLIEQNWNLKETAQILFIHRNTLMKRREKIEALSADTMGMELHAALQMGIYAGMIKKYFY